LRKRISAANKGNNMNYQIQGLSIHAEVHGTAEPALVFLHYWGGTSRTWRKVTAELEGQFKTVAYDARGWGKSDKTLAGYKLADLADEALPLVKALGIKQYVLVGHSMGGKVAQLAASQRPEWLSGLILVAPAQPTPRHNPP
jgi:pimeloyl-ACP methyl ester carboxylesterase